MRVSKEVTEKKQSFVISYFQKHPEAEVQKVQLELAKKFGHGYTPQKLAELRTEAEKLAREALPAPAPPDPQPASAEAAAPIPTTKATKECPKCKTVKEVEAEFGFRTVNGVKKEQAWCRICRAGPAKAAVIETRARAVASEPLNPAVPQPVIDAANALLKIMRENRVVKSNVEASGKTVFQVLHPDEKEVHLGGRRAGDPPPTVKL